MTAIKEILKTEAANSGYIYIMMGCSGKHINVPHICLLCTVELVT
jgi:hypothetical protein